MKLSGNYSGTGVLIVSDHGGIVSGILGRGSALVSEVVLYSKHVSHASRGSGVIAVIQDDINSFRFAVLP